MSSRMIGVVVLSAVACLASRVQAQHYFQSSNGTISFIKSPFADVGNPANWDTITPGVAITRGNTAGLFNPITEPAYQGFSPEGTLWYFGGTVQDVIDGAITLSQFDNWMFAHDSNPPSVVNENGVLYLVKEDAFVDIRFTQWSVGSSGGGGFRYVRAVVSLPPSCQGDVSGPGGEPDGEVGIDDLNAVLSAWGASIEPGSTLDLAGNDGLVDVNDLNVILSNWQSCG